MNKPTELDRAQLKNDFKNMYKEIGFGGSLQVLYELLISAEILSEVLAEKMEAKSGK